MAREQDSLRRGLTRPALARRVAPPRLPAADADKLDRASHELRIAKKDLVTALVARAQIDDMPRSPGPESPPGRRIGDGWRFSRAAVLAWPAG